MKYRILLIICLFAGISVCMNGQTVTPESKQKQNVTFESTDTALVNTFNWAVKQALFYRGDSNDPVGPWYEAALPARYAFCMRDVSHQVIGAEILGMGRENENMLRKFAVNISGSKKWCSYWEINKWDKPAPVDYENDNNFWYNLNANFDVIYACWRLYNWTGNKNYITDPAFINFYNKSLNEYIKAWKLEPDSLLKRPEDLNVDPIADKKRFFHGYGLASYAEDVRGLEMSTDLIAAVYQGYKSYSEILNAAGKTADGKLYAQKADEYYQVLNTKWWDPSAKLFNTYHTYDGNFGKGEGEAFLIWFDALKENEKLGSTIDHLSSKTWNVENTSYFPYLFYLNGYWDKAYKYLLYCSDPSTKRREYPEVSFGVIEGIVKGLMGVTPDAVTGTVSTIHRATDQRTSKLENLTVLGTSLNIAHIGKDKSSVRNNGPVPIKWRAEFTGIYSKARIGTKVIKAKMGRDRQGKPVSYVDLKVNPGQQVEVIAF